MLDDVFDRLLRAVAEACRSVYRERLIGIAVFGSVARGTMRPDSDVDLLVVADPLPQGRLVRMEEFDGVERLVEPALAEAEERGVSTRLAPIVRTIEELGRSGFLRFDIACDGKVLDDPDGRLAAYMAGVREGLERRGAERRSFRGLPYWVLDPDVRPGQVVEL
jgi:hypothetical protein